MHNTFTFHATNRTPTPKLQVILGSHKVKAFVAAPKGFDDFGLVRLGMEYGFLARIHSGKYVRVNGSQVQELDRCEVEAAIDRIRRTGRGEPYAIPRSHERPSLEPRCNPTVTFRKSRKNLHSTAVPVDFRSQTASHH